MNRNIFLAACWLLCVSFFVWQLALGWPLIEQLRLREIGADPFGDLTTVIKSADCYVNYDFKGMYSKVLPDACNYLYGNLLIFLLVSMGVTVSFAPFIAGMLTLIYISIAFMLFRNLPFWKLAIALLAIASPPIWLLLERANFDLLIFILLYGAAIASAKSRFGLSAIIIAVTALIKFYTLPLLLVPFLRSGLKGRLLVASIGIVTATVIALEVSVRPSFPAWIFPAWGSPTPLLTFQFVGLFPDYKLALASGLLLLLIGSVVIYRFWGPEIKNFIDKDFFDFVGSSSPSDQFSILSGLTFLICYLSGMNFDYRLVFLVPVLAWALKTENFDLPARIGLLAGTTASMWPSILSFNALPGPLAAFGTLVQDISIGVIAALVLVICGLVFRSLFFSSRGS